MVLTKRQLSYRSVLQHIKTVLVHQHGANLVSDRTHYEVGGLAKKFKLSTGGCIEIRKLKWRFKKPNQPKFAAILKLILQESYGSKIATGGTVEETLANAYAKPLGRYKLEFEFLNEKNSLRRFLELHGTKEWKEVQQKARVVRLLKRTRAN
jgi:hypothetical protein